MITTIKTAPKEVVPKKVLIPEFSFAGIKARPGVYRVKSPEYENIRIISIDSRTVLYYDTDNGELETACSSWISDKFIEIVGARVLFNIF